MADDKGILIASNIIPAMSDGVVRDHATHIAKYGKGGWREVATITERDAITNARREAGMSVYVTSEKKLYILNDDLETWTLFESGKINTISVNGEELPVVEKNVDITVPTKTSDIINDSDFQNSTQVQTAIENNIVNNVTSTDTNKSLSANMGKSLQDQIDNLQGRGKYLSIWDSTTGLAMDEPPVNPYTVENGSYFIVGKIATLDGQVNYKPNGGVYDKDVPSTTIETAEVKVNDTYYYDAGGNTWRLLDVPEKEIAFSSIAGSPYDNTNLSNVLDDKANTDDLADIAFSGSYTDASNKPSINGITLEGNKTQGELDIRTYSPYPDDFVIDDSFEALVDSILNSTGAKQGNAYLGTISGDYMPWGYGGAECKIEYMQDDIAVLSINSADVAPYTWSYNTYSGDYTWKSNILQAKTMPDTWYTENVIIQYIGETTTDYTNGYFYKCVDGEWVELEVQKVTPAIWGNITGTLSDQEDLKESLDTKIEYAGQIKEWIDE